MNIKAYKKEIIRTWNTGHTHTEQICNATLGLVGEVGEFWRSREEFELGDIYYYAYTLARLLDLPVTSPGPFNRGAELIESSVDVAECVKKLLFHGPCLERKGIILEDTLRHLDDLLSAAAWEAHLIGITPEKAMRFNIDKLRQRHPDGFSPKYMDEK